MTLLCVCVCVCTSLNQTLNPIAYLNSSLARVPVYCGAFGECVHVYACARSCVCVDVHARASVLATTLKHNSSDLLLSSGDYTSRCSLCLSLYARVFMYICIYIHISRTHVRARMLSLQMQIYVCMHGYVYVHIYHIPRTHARAHQSKLACVCVRILFTHAHTRTYAACTHARELDPPTLPRNRIH